MGIAVGLLILAFVLVTLFAGSVETTFSDDYFSIKASFYDDLTVFYDRVESVEYRDGNVDGSRVFGLGSFRLLLADNEDIFAYTRTTDRAQLLIVCNFHGKQIDNPLESEEKAILCNYSGEPVPGKLRPFEARIYLR